jgi:hypothetical protein
MARGRKRTIINGEQLNLYIAADVKAALSRMAFDAEVSIGQIITQLVEEKKKNVPKPDKVVPLNAK